MREIQVQSLGWEDLLEKEMATHSSILDWKIPGCRKESDTTELLHLNFSTLVIKCIDSRGRAQATSCLWHLLDEWFCIHLHSMCATFFFSFIFNSWRLITLQYCSGFCHTLTWISHGFSCIPHPDPPSLLPLYPIPLGLPSAPGLSTCLMHPTWAGDLFHHR